MLTLLLACGGGQVPPLPAVLAPCPGKPNCVYSRATEERHAIEPFPAGDATWETLHHVVMAMENVELLHEEPTYRQYVFSTALWGFRDDVQFELASEDGLIHVRSASRVGQSDLGVNRKRVETLRAALQKASNP